MTPAGTKEPPSTNGDNGGRRDAGGHFAKGNPGGPGNPFARRVARLRSLLLDALTDTDFEGIVKALADRAKAGDVAAAKLVLQYAVGAPVPATNPDKLEIEELRIESEWHDAKRENNLLTLLS